MNIIKRLRHLLYLIKRGPRYARKNFGAIGRGCVIGRNCDLVPRNMYLGDYVIIQNRNNFISFRGKLVVKKYSVISSGCIIVPSTHLAAPGIPFYFQARDHYGDEDRTIVIEEDCWVGAGAILLPKSSLGRGSVVAAGSVVTRPFPPYAVIAGNPARIVGVKFSFDDILLHESRIYPPEERLDPAALNDLFDTVFAGMKPLKKCSDGIYADYARQSNKRQG